jgi:hypothetical protein
MDIIIESKAENVPADRRGNTRGQKRHAKGSRKEAKNTRVYVTDTTNVEQEMCGYTANNWSQRTSNKGFKEKKPYQENIQ